MKTSFRKSFLRDLKKLKDQRVRAQVRAATEGVEAAGGLSDLPGVTKMSGGGSYYRIRIGDYRIGLSVEGDEAEFVRVLHPLTATAYSPPGAAGEGQLCPFCCLQNWSPAGEYERDRQPLIQ